MRPGPRLKGGELKRTAGRYDLWILIPVLCLTGMGLVMVFSASTNLAAHRLGDNYFYLKRQALFVCIGIITMVVAKNIPCRIFSRLVYLLLFMSLCLMGMVLIPGLGAKIGGATRWFRLGSFSFQPSEFAKFALAVYLAYSMSKKGADMRHFSTGLFPHLLVAGVFMCLIVLQPDLGTAVIIGCWLVILLFVGGVNPFQLAGVLSLFAPVVFLLVLHADYRLKRWWAFLHPWKDPRGIGFQIVHSFLAFGSGGVFGVGLGNSKQKLFYLPESHTDFILSIVAEEMGFLGIGITIILFGVLIVRGIKVALSAKDLYSSYLALGLSAFIGLQVVVNMGVVMGLLPTKGLTLPLISYGGSSLIMTFLSIGVLLNISSAS
ncbi:MAG: putative lipid II flippase FtsW [Deltaproteobacteria bacterium]